MNLRDEHPNPQWERQNYQSLNGEWEFDFDFGKSARERRLFERNESLSKKIIVPFCPESELSQIGYKDFMNAVCYRKTIELTKDECEKNIFLHFGAVDFESFVYVNGKEAFHHIGGYSSFNVNITPYVSEGENVIFVIANDDTKSQDQPSGKQSETFGSQGCYYTRTTGIWQSVWLEFVPKNYIKGAKYYTDIDNMTLTITGSVFGSGTVFAKALFNKNTVGEAKAYVSGGFFTLCLKLDELHLWQLGEGNLYDLELSFGEDFVKSYFGMRKVELDGKRFKLNGKTVFLRMVLDQGFYKDGIYTAKNDDELERDIHLSFDAGFNGARLHEKIFEPRFLYHCDRLGYMVWGETPNWGMDCRSAVAVENHLNEWLETIERDFNHPSIIGWCPFNETWGYVEKQLKDRAIETFYKLTKQLDPTRLVVDTSGNYHCEDIDIFDTHYYDQNPKTFKEAYEKLCDGILKDNPDPNGYRGEAVFVSEYGGIKWATSENQSGWGYGQGPKTEDEFIKRYEALTSTLLENPYIMGFCYTQLYDVEQEINGLYTYERAPKFDMNIIKKINSKKAAIEE